MVTGGVAVAYWCGERKCRDLDLVIPVFKKPGSWAHAITLPPPKTRPIDLHMVRHKDNRKWGDSFVEIVAGAIRSAEVTDRYGFQIKVAPVEYLRYVKSKLTGIRKDMKDVNDFVELTKL